MSKLKHIVTEPREGNQFNAKIKEFSKYAKGKDTNGAVFFVVCRSDNYFFITV